MTSIANRHGAGGDARARAALARDAAFGRIGRTRRWLLLAAVAMTAGLAALASSLLPGKSLGSTGAQHRLRTPGEDSGAHTRKAAASPAAAPALPAPAGAAQLGLQGPVQAPQSSPPPPSQAAPPPAQSSPPPAPAPAPSPPAAASGGVVSGGS